MSTEQTAMSINDKQALPAAVTDEAARIGQMLQLAVEKGVPAESLEKLVNLHERITDRMAAAEYARAFAEFKRSCPPVEKKRSTKETGQRSGAQFKMKYANAEDIAEVVDPILFPLGFTYTFSLEHNERNVVGVFTLMHVSGHAVTSRSSAFSVESSLPVSPQQKQVATETYAKRQAMIAGLGIVTVDEDTEGGNREAITAEQAATLDALLDEVKADRAAFLKWAGADGVAHVAASRFEQAVAMLERKRR